jgi:hypothetical protein
VLLAGLGLLAASLPLTLAIEAWMVRAMGRVPEGVIGRWSLAYIRVRMKTEMLEAAGAWLAGALFWPVWLRWAGMKVGRGCEISTILDTVPRWWKSARRHSWRTASTSAGRASIAAPSRWPHAAREQRVSGQSRGDSGGRSLPDNVLLGVCTVAGEAMESGRSWFGHPPFELPRREVVACDRKLTVKPSAVAILHAAVLGTAALRTADPAGAGGVVVGAGGVHRGSGGGLRGGAGGGSGAVRAGASGEVGAAGQNTAGAAPILGLLVRTVGLALWLGELGASRRWCTWKARCCSPGICARWG